MQFVETDRAWLERRLRQVQYELDRTPAWWEAAVAQLQAEQQGLLTQLAQLGAS